MRNLEYKYFRNREEFRTWLQEFHEKSTGIWLTFYKKNSGRECIKYPEALEEALCFGWIDSIIKKIDEEKYARKITPRKDIKKWSDLNKTIVNKLIQKGLMTQSGLNKIDSYIRNGKVEWGETKQKLESKPDPDIPEFIINKFVQNEPAFEYFNILPPSQKRLYTRWINSPKKEETVQKRLMEAIRLLKKNEKLGLK